MNAGREFLDFAGMASGAKRRAASGWIYYLVRVPMASHAGCGTIRFSERRMSVGRQLSGDFSVAGKARGRCALCRVRELGSPCVAIQAAKILVDAVRERLALYGDELALRVSQTGGRSVAGKAIV